jgi:hypothetical protein
MARSANRSEAKKRALASHAASCCPAGTRRPPPAAPSPIAIVRRQFSDHDRSRLEPMGAMKPKSFASQPKRQSETTPPSVRAEDKPSRLTFGLPGNTSQRAERRRALMDEHRETLRRLGK